MQARTSRRVVAAAVVGMAALSALAQNTAKLHCIEVGYNPPMPLPDRDGHALSVNEYTCRVEGGPFDGAVTTGSQVWEWDKANAVLVAGHSVSRRPAGPGVGAAVGVAEDREGRTITVAADGKPPVWTASGKGILRMAAGAAGPQAGRPYTWTAKVTVPGRFVVDLRYD